MKNYIYYEEGGDDWYKQFIENPLRDLVYILRNNGFNTECSCGHDMYIQCQYILDGEIMDLHHILNCYFQENGLPVDYEIKINIKVVDGKTYSSMDIIFPNKKKLKRKMKKINSQKSKDK